MTPFIPSQGVVFIKIMVDKNKIKLYRFIKRFFNNDKQKDHFATIFRFIGFALWFPFGHFCYAYIYKEIHSQDIYVEFTLLGLFMGLGMQIFGGIILSNRKKSLRNDV